MIQAKEVRRHKIAVRTRGPQPQGSSSQTFSLHARLREEWLGTAGAVTEKACWSIDGASRSLTTISLLALLHACSPLRSVPGPGRRRKAPWRTSLSVRLPRPPHPRKVLLDVGALVLCGLVLLCCDSSGPCRVRTESAVAPVARAWARRTAR